MAMLVQVVWSLFLLVIMTSPLAAQNSTFDPPALYLTWQRDPARTMTVCWHTLDEANPQVFYRPLGGPTNWLTQLGYSRPLAGTVRIVQIAELTGLQPATDYEFCFWPGERRFKFRTAPADLSRPVRFISGGDVYHERKWMDAMNELAGKFDPLFVVIGGDLAYAGDKDKPEKMERWDTYFESWKAKARTPDGRLVPLLVSIGNHEVRGSWHQTVSHAGASRLQLSRFRELS